MGNLPGHDLNRFVHEYVRAWNAHDSGHVAAFFAADYEGTDVADALPERGPQGAREMAERYVQAFPDLHFTVEEIVAQDNCVAFAWTAQGTQRGPFMNIPATGRPVAMRGMSLLTLEDGKIKQGLHVWDVAGLLRAIGLLPELYSER